MAYYVVGGFDMTGRALRKRRWFRSLKQAENFIGNVIQKEDPRGVFEGRYYIDGPCPAPRHLKQRKR